jgi:(p)ppGpp synthase/HD superfamily hydrolase
VKRFESWSSWQKAKEGLQSRLPEETVESLAKAYGFAQHWHGNQTRPTGAPYTTHLIETLEILAIGLKVTDADVLTTGLLHDVIEDTPCTLAEVRESFGSRVAEFVGWLTKPDTKPDQDKTTVREDYLKRFPLAPYEVLLVKLADRYSNVQQLHTHPRAEKQRSYYSETCRWFVPAAARIPYFQELFAAWQKHYEYLGHKNGAPVD